MYKTIFRKISFALVGLALVSSIGVGHSYASSEEQQPVLNQTHESSSNQLDTSRTEEISTSDGGYLTTGEIDVTSSSGYVVTKALIRKLDANRKIQWERTIVHANSDYTTARSAIETNDGGFVIGGATTNYDGKPYRAIFVAKLSAQGKVEWQKEFGDGYTNAYADIVVETTDGGFVFTGFSSSTYAEASAYVLKVNAQGTKLWLKYYRFGSNQNFNDIIATPDGGTIVVGGLNSIIGSGENDAALVTKLDSNGEIVWTKKFLQPYSERTAYSIVASCEGGYLVASRTRDGVNYLTYIDENGEVIWERVLGGNASGPTAPLSGGTDRAYENQPARSAGCENPPEERTLTGIAFTDSIKKITVGEKATLTVKAHYSDGSEAALSDSVTFTSADKLTATVDSKGLVTGVKPGTTTIQAVYQGHTAQLQVEVQSGSGNPGPVEGTFYLDSEEYSLTAGTSLDTIAWFKDKDGVTHNVTKQSVFKSENPSVVDYDADGNINGLRAGITYITAEYQGQTYKALVQVVRASVPK